MGTGGGSGDSTLFEDWSKEKLNKYDIDVQTYDHTNVHNRPSILIDSYTKRRKYLSIFYLWDELTDYLLSS